MFLRRPMTRHVILRKTASNNSHVIRQQARVTAGPVCGFFHTEEYSDIQCMSDSSYVVLFSPHYFSFLTSKKILDFFFCISQ